MPPVISITSPASGATVRGTIMVAGTASDDQGVIRSIHVQIDGKTPRAVTPAPTWSYLFDTSRLSPGSHLVAAFARDRAGNTGYTEISVVVAGGPNPGPSPSPSPSPAPSPSPSPSPPPGPGEQYVRQGPAVLGVRSDDVNGHTTDLLESQIGRRFGGIRNNQRIFYPLPGKEEDQAFDAGRRFVIRNAEANQLDANGDKVATCWIDWANGVYDWRLAEVVASIKADPRWTHANPYIFAFNKEMNLTGPTHPTCGTPEEYKLAARHIWDYFKNAGILWRYGGQVLVAWVPSGSAFRVGYANQYDPNVGPDGVTVVGDYYDLVGEDIYDRTDTDGHLNTTDPRWLFDPAHAYAVMRGKPLIIPEFGVAEDLVNDGVNEKAQVFSQVASVLASYGSGVPGAVVAVYYSNVEPYWPDTSPQALNAFTQMARSQFFGG